MSTYETSVHISKKSSKWKYGAARGITAHVEAITQEGIFHWFTDLNNQPRVYQSIHPSSVN